MIEGGTLANPREYSNRLVTTVTSVNDPDGQAPKVITLQNHNGLRALFMDIGATWLSCQVPLADGFREVVLGSATLNEYRASSCYLGATIGRYANRINAGRFRLDERTVQLAVNEKGNTLHGGPSGFDRRRWRVIEQDAQSVLFELNSPSGDQGFPGNVRATVRYNITDDNAVQIEFNASSDASTPLNLTNHTYFNLENAASGIDVRSHRLRLESDYYLPVNQAGIPVQGLCDVDSSAFDFRQMRTIGSTPGTGYDHAFLLRSPKSTPGSTPTPSLDEPVAILRAPDESLDLLVFTNKPALQVYTGSGLDGTPTRNSTCYAAYAGIALETQFLPDTPNHPEWPQPGCFYGEGDVYQFTTRYKFATRN